MGRDRGGGGEVKEQTIAVTGGTIPKDEVGENHPETLKSNNNLIGLYEAWGKLELAEQWRAKLPQKVATKQYFTDIQLPDKA